MREKLFKRFTKVLKDKGGYTLIEVAAVVAVTATLAAVVIPVALDKIEKSKLATAKSDVQALAAGVGSLFADTGEWPARNASASNSLYALRTGTNTGDLFSASDDPAAGTWGQTSAAATTDIANDHLVVNEPFDQTTNVYSQWSGPYTDSLLDKQDPWGNNYLIWVRAMWDSGTTQYGWVISAGPDGTMDTAADSAQVGDDDIGIVLYSKR